MKVGVNHNHRSDVAVWSVGLEAALYPPERRLYPNRPVATEDGAYKNRDELALRNAFTCTTIRVLRRAYVCRLPEIERERVGKVVHLQCAAAIQVQRQ